MSIVPLHQMGRVGLLKDTPFHELSVYAWTKGKNIRFAAGAVESFLGHTTLLSPLDFEPRHLAHVIGASANFLVYLSNAKAVAIDGALTQFDLTRAVGGDYGATDTVLWNSTVLTGIPFFNNFTDVPQYWAPIAGAQKLQDLTAFPATLRLKVLRSFKGFLVGLWASKSGVQYPHMVKWSNVADPGTLPSSWDEADATTLAGELDLADTSGRLVDCLPLGDVNMIYKEDCVWSQAFIGAPFVFQHRKQFSDFGLFGQDCVVEFERRHVLLSQDNLIVHDGSSFKRLLDKQWQRELFSRIDMTYRQRVKLQTFPARQELWICYPVVGGSGWQQEALVWNWKENTLGLRELPDVSSMANSDFPATVDTFDGGESGTMDTDLSLFDNLSFLNISPVMASPVSPFAIYNSERGFTFSGVNKTSMVERVGLAIDGGQTLEKEPRLDLTTIKQVNAIYPRMQVSDYTKLKFYVGSQMTLDGPVTWHGPFTCDQTTGFKFNCSVSARLLGLRIESTEPVYWKLWGMDVELDKIGRF